MTMKSNLKIAVSVFTLLGAGLLPGLNNSAYAWDCLLDTNNDGNADTDVDTDAGADTGGINSNLACGENAVAGGIGNEATALGSSAAAAEGATAVGRSAIAAGPRSVAMGFSASSAGSGAVAIGEQASGAATNAVAVGQSANASGPLTIAIGGGAQSTGGASTAVGAISNASGQNSVAMGALARATNLNSIAIGTNTVAGFDDAIVIGFDASAAEAGQIVLGAADTFTILGNGRMGLGTATPDGSLEINSGMADTQLILTNSGAEWELKSKAATGRLTFGNIVNGNKPFKLGATAVNNLLNVGTVANDQVDIKGNLVITGTVTTGGPTCGGGCDAVFDVDYDLPSIEEHARAMFANKHLPEVGPTIPLAPINLSEQYGKMLNELEKAHIYIAQQEVRLARLEKLLAE